jgi:hypothetical protein
MSNRFYEVGWDVEHLLNVISKILSALVVVLLHGPLDLEILRKERQQGIERTITPKEHKRKNDLALSADVRSLDQRTGVVIR